MVSLLYAYKPLANWVSFCHMTNDHCDESTGVRDIFQGSEIPVDMDAFWRFLEPNRKSA